MQRHPGRPAGRGREARRRKFSAGRVQPKRIDPAALAFSAARRADEDEHPVPAFPCRLRPRPRTQRARRRHERAHYHRERDLQPHHHFFPALPPSAAGLNIAHPPDGTAAPPDFTPNLSPPNRPPSPCPLVTLSPCHLV